jgi:NAD(P)-dependent dehydrogenase (short-subunit alcohol dehydrogenase family)
VSINADLAGKRILVVGASSGIGRAVALAAASAGAAVAVVGRRGNLLDEVVKEAGGGVAIVADVTDEGSAERAVAEALSGLGGIDAVLLPLASSPFGFLDSTDAATWQRTFATNVIAPSLVTRFALPVLADGGFVGYVSSTSASKPLQALGAYGASKAALDHSIMTWRLEHTEVRFLRLVVGPTLPTELYRDYDFDLVNKVMPLWAAHGLMEVSFMAVEDVGRAIAEAGAWILDHPAIVVEDIVLKPPIRTMTAAEVEALVRTYEPDGDGPSGTSDAGAALASAAGRSPAPTAVDPAPTAVDPAPTAIDMVQATRTRDVGAGGAAQSSG